ncbi:peroxide stress protein YaaA [Companilactobacillus baiquanensis]|uniref:UPF0246 protein ACFP1F_02510 n=1 Tax=Companilactobacillus baiquanensis TaxID=2486005 RepID=A0ABW1USC8_9LACO|nr:peroxide stress protein YaaA [Companilactobacillus baiquanensis]
MKIIISPAKKMVVDTDSFDYEQLPQYLDKSKLILKEMRKLTYKEAKKLWRCSDKLAEANFQWLQELEISNHLTPALLAFSGIQYQYMAPDLFTEPALAYVKNNLRILSGFYGILRPFDGVVPYRLEMQSNLKVSGSNLYDFWNSQIYQALGGMEDIVNLASKEYAKTIIPFLAPDQKFVTIVFGSIVDGKLKTKAALAKMARGEMVRFMAENQITKIEDIKYFSHPDWEYSPERSTKEQIVFVFQG